VGGLTKTGHCGVHLVVSTDTSIAQVEELHPCTGTSQLDFADGGAVLMEQAGEAARWWCRSHGQQAGEAAGWGSRRRGAATSEPPLSTSTSALITGSVSASFDNLSVHASTMGPVRAPSRRPDDCPLRALEPSAIGLDPTGCRGRRAAERSAVRLSMARRAAECSSAVRQSMAHPARPASPLCVCDRGSTYFFRVRE